MSLIFNETEIENVTFNGVELDAIVYNGVTVWESINIDFVQQGNAGTFTATQKIKGVLICSAYRNERDGVEPKKCSITVSAFTGSKCEELSSDKWHGDKWIEGTGWYYGGEGNLRIYLVECEKGDTFTIASSYACNVTLINCNKANAEVITYEVLSGAQADFKKGIVIGVAHRGYGSSAVDFTMTNVSCDSYEEISSTASGTGKCTIAKVSGHARDKIEFKIKTSDYANGIMKLINIK